MNAWRMSSNSPSVDLVTQALHTTSITDVSPQPDNDNHDRSGAGRLGWAGQKLPLADDNGQHEKYPNSGVSGGKPRSFRGQPRDRGRGDGGRRAKGYRRLWEQVTKVGRGQALENDGKPPLGDLSVEELVRIIQALPPDKSVVQAVSQALAYLDSRALAALLKELSKCGHSQRAVELFDWLRSLEPGHELASLCDVYTYTTVISLCGQMQQLRRALELVAELRSRGIQCNVHTYSSLMNVCIKCGELELALDVYHQMKSEGSKPNVVTYNTLIDVYGKTGQWEKAVKVLDTMLEEGLEPEVRTYNTAIIACNMCGQPHESLKVYERLLEAGLTPISTTYTALISAYGKAGQLERALEVFSEMLRCGCERSVITYSSLISACEKAARWQLALELFNQMHQEGCSPNTVTFNSLITACAQGSQWEKAAEIFEQMKAHGCKPDVVTYTALIGAYEKGGRWRRAVKVFDQMQHQGCKPDAIIYHTVIDMLWGTGVLCAQNKALQLFNMAVRNCQFRLGVQTSYGDDGSRDVVVPSLSVAVAVLAIQRWLTELGSQLEKEGVKAQRERVRLTLGRGRAQREQTAASVREAVMAMLKGLGAPFGRPTDLDSSHHLECQSWELNDWLMIHKTSHLLSSWLADVSGSDTKRLRYSEQLSAEAAVEQKCVEKFASVQHFESTHRLSFQAMGQGYLALRQHYIDTAFHLAASLELREETVYDAVLLMDLVMSTGIQLSDSFGMLFVAGVLLIAARQCESPERVPKEPQLDMVASFPMGSVAKMEANIRLALNQDMTSISAYRCLKLYFERLGYNVTDTSNLPPSLAPLFAQLRLSLLSPAFLNFRPSIVAAALLHRDRRLRGISPFWPTALAHLTGLHDLSSPEFLAASEGADMLDAAAFAASRGPAVPPVMMHMV